MVLTNPTTFTNWLPPHSIAWYKQLSQIQNEYTYPWNSTITEPNGETIFEHEVNQIIANKKVLDIGCGDGSFTLQCSSVAKEIVGFDVTDSFIQVGQNNEKPNVSFVIGNVKIGLPFKRNEFDCAYIRKGPTSAYLQLKNLVKTKGEILGLHPGDDMGKELSLLFPNLFLPSIGTPILTSITQKLEQCQFSDFKIEIINCIEYLHSALDVIKLRCFGQHPSIYKRILKNDLLEISRIFEQNATKDGLPITFSRYIVKVVV